MESFVTVTFTLVLFGLPGWLCLSLSKHLSKQLSFFEKVYLVLGVSMLMTGWLGLILVEFANYSAPALTALVALVVLIVGLATWRLRGRAKTHWRLGEALVVLGLAVFAIVVYFPPFEYVLGGRDPGVYANAGFHVARTGNLKFVDELVRELSPESRALFFRVDGDLPDWSQPRYLGFHLERPETGLVVPQGLHLYPVWMGIAASLYEMKAGLYATPFFATLGLLGFFFAVQRLFGFRVAALASILLAVFQLQVWFARYPNAEVVVQFLFWFLLWCFFFMQEERSVLAGVVGGLALGSMFLVRIETILFTIPVGVCLGWARLERRFSKPEFAFVGVAGALALHAIVHARIFAAPYVNSVFGRWYWNWVARNLVWLALLGLVVFAIFDRYLPRWIPQLRRLVSLPWVGYCSMGVVWLLSLYAYFIRPVWHGARVAPHDAEAFVRMNWYLYPVGVFLAVVGMMVVVYRPKASWNLFVLTAITFSLFFFYKIRVSNDHFFGMRRFIPIILPCFFVAIAYLFVTISSRFSTLGRIAAGLGMVSLATVYSLDGRPLWKHNEFRGSIGFMDELARHVGDDDIVIFPRREGLHLLEPPLAEMHGKKVLEFYTLSPDRNLLEATLAEWQNRYADVYFVTNYKVSLSGLFTRQVRDFLLPSEIYEYTYLGPPKRAKPFHLRFSLSKAVDLDELAARLPPIERIDVGAQGDDTTLAWFHDAELENEISYRWTQRTSSVFFPHFDPDTRSVRLRIGGPPNEQVPIPEVELTLNDQTLARWTPSHRFEIAEFEIPPELARSASSEHAVFRLHSIPWRPEDWIPNATDIRDLGVRMDWIEIH